MDSFLPLILVIGIFSTILTSTLKMPVHTFHNQVLGTEIAQTDDNSTSPDQPTDTPSNTDAPPPDTPEPTFEPTSTDSADIGSPEPTVEETASPMESPIEFVNPANTAAVINPDSVINTTQNLTQDTIDQVSQEETSINNETDPIAQTQILLDLGTNNVEALNDSIKMSNWSSVNFTTQRLNDVIDRASDNSNKAGSLENLALRQQISDLCETSDPILRVYALTVPQDLEQDIEIGRGKCLKLQQ
jgi:hypothetical protein